MKKLASIIITAAVLVAAPAMAEGDPIAVVNIQKLMNESGAAKSVREQLENKQKSFQADITKKEEQLKKEDQELGKQKGVLSKEAFEEKAHEFRKKVTDVQKEVQSKKAMLDTGANRSWAQIQKAVTEIVAELSKEKGFSVALPTETPTSQILFADSRLDITEEVLTRLNKKLPKIDVQFDAKK